MTEEWRDLPRFRFGDTAGMADDLLALVLAGIKTATCCAVEQDGAVPSVGNRQVVLDGIGRPRVVIETEEVEKLAFDRVDAAFACAEGEGNRSLDAWRAAHRSFFERNGGFRPDMMLWCERFRLVAVLPTD